jgi:hypothetical protein
MWTYSEVGDDGCEALRSLAMEATKLLNIEISAGCIDCHQKVRVVARWSDIYRGHGEYISMGVG